MAANRRGVGCGAEREFAVGDMDGFRRELAESLISLPWLRAFFMNQRVPLPDGDDGFRGIHPDLELFIEFVWPAYVEVSELVHACRSFLSETRVPEAEARLRKRTGLARSRSGGGCVERRLTQLARSDDGNSCYRCSALSFDAQRVLIR